MLLITANIFFKSTFETYRLMVIMPAVVKYELVQAISDEVSPPLEAYVNHGKWLVKCECGGCEKVWEEGWMMCQSCWNGNHKHKYRRTIFPKERLKIEKLLEVRPLPNRNWYPNETIGDLVKENEEHKTELLEVS